ncbi:pentapeptide repeat-containing protein [Actinokineospora sp. UTMC 2448]|uniref:pentapeptide repeat-containing protein n=1 Tax=Actinokineospora sp. UTMC 2448 TaxID=2268449 RepID=UPI00216491FA|nr:pentapeptide repeat-containing protein [Actinokineospora sp. UTMC 2448]UVS81720.1 Serine/threonine-protein kinase B [Actinokineospora sp. UTMC 2448]
MRPRVVVIALVSAGLALLAYQVVVRVDLGWLADWWPAVAGVLAVAAAVVLAARGGRERAGTHDWNRTTGLITALTAVGALVFTGLSLQATRQQTMVGEQTQVTDRFLRAVEQLASPGDDQVHLRIGGIFALERVAVDSARDRPTVEELLAAFIRDRSRRPADGACPPTPMDVDAAFRVLARRPPSESVHPIDLRETCLVGVSAPRADLRRVSLVRSDLTGANLYQATLGLTSFADATLVGVRFADVSFASFAFVHGADLSRADLTRADLSGLDLSGVNLSGADLTGAKHSPGTKVSTAVKDSTTVGAWW